MRKVSVEFRQLRSRWTIPGIFNDRKCWHSVTVLGRERNASTRAWNWINERSVLWLSLRPFRNVFVGSPISFSLSLGGLSRTVPSRRSIPRPRERNSTFGAVPELRETVTRCRFSVSRNRVAWRPSLARIPFPDNYRSEFWVVPSTKITNFTKEKRT